ncbi:hypothetical protein G5C51_32425 [Streptomyces sp. A7024]|uniref:Uncharacterized protein n=1 Tax=Streptomyces coryli TaxID=1128680 RepID=A0A6G4UB83_9ACTN|nr:DUF5819 family protein [Streptomyces coryli]NGN68587.1 hypothetical protein [Streptomyces coryli]
MPAALKEKQEAPPRRVLDAAEHLAPRGMPLRRRRSRSLRAGFATVCLLAAYHLGMVFLAIAPPNVIKDHSMQQVQWWIYPWFEQGWKMFAPEPVSTNRAFEVRVRNGTKVSRWENLTAADDAEIRGDLITSRQHANVLRRVWDGMESLDKKKGPRNPGEAIRFTYARNVVVQRMEALGYENFSKIQIRVRLQKVPPHNNVNAEQPWQTMMLPWWGVPAK